MCPKKVSIKSDPKKCPKKVSKKWPKKCLKKCPEQVSCSHCDIGATAISAGFLYKEIRCGKGWSSQILMTQTMHVVPRVTTVSTLGVKMGGTKGKTLQKFQNCPYQSLTCKNCLYCKLLSKPCCCLICLYCLYCHNCLCLTYPLPIPNRS